MAPHGTKTCKLLLEMNTLKQIRARGVRYVSTRRFVSFVFLAKDLLNFSCLVLLV